jgi:hypothetical protein
MENRLAIESFGDAVVTPRKPEGKVGFKGVFNVECRDKDGNLKWTDVAHNGVVDVGINKLLDIMFRAITQITVWYMGLIDSSGFTGLVAGDTLPSHAGWTENTAYTVTAGSTQRGTWTPSAAASKSITNGTAVAFTMTGAGTIKGFFLCQDQLKATSTNLLWATALFATGDQVVAIGDILNVTYTISAA